MMGIISGYRVLAPELRVKFGGAGATGERKRVAAVIREMTNTPKVILVHGHPDSNYREYFGVYHRRNMVVNDRHMYNKEDSNKVNIWFDSHGNWNIGPTPNLSKMATSRSYLQVRDSALSPHQVADFWRSADMEGIGNRVQRDIKADEISYEEALRALRERYRKNFKPTKTKHQKDL